MQGERLQTVQFILAYTKFDQEQYWKISRALSLVECMVNHDFTVQEIHFHMREMILEAITRTGGKPKKPSGAKTVIECFNYESYEDTKTGDLQFWYNDKTNSTKLIQKTFKFCIL